MLCFTPFGQIHLLIILDGDVDCQERFFDGVCKVFAQKIQEHIRLLRAFRDHACSTFILDCASFFHPYNPLTFHPSILPSSFLPTFLPSHSSFINLLCTKLTSMGFCQNQRQLVKVNFKCTRNPFRVLRVIRSSANRVQ